MLDNMANINDFEGSSKTRIYCKYLKTKKKKPQLVNTTGQLRLNASDGKILLTDVVDV